MPHPFLLEAHAQIRRALVLPDGYGVLLVAGPPGVGKSALAQACSAADPAHPESGLGLPCQDGSIPLVSVTAKTGMMFKSRWKGLLQDILKIVNPPLAEARGSGSRALSDGFSIPRLESAVIDALICRKTVGVLVDECQDLVPSGSTADVNEMAQSLKHLGSAAKTVLVLFGSYSLLDFLGVSAQLSRRCNVVHFPRYDIAKPADSATFQRVFSTFCAAAPTLLPYDQLSRDLPLLYTGSSGGTGNLRLWLIRAAGRAVQDGAPCVTAAHLRAEVLTDTSIKINFSAAQSGEAEIAKLHSSLDAITASVFHAVPFAAASLPKPKRNPGKPNPGKRNPVRDSTGDTTGEAVAA